MALSPNAANKLNNEFDSYNNLSSLCKDIFIANNFTTKKTLIILLTYILTLIIGYLLVMIMPFKIIFESIVDINLTVSVGLIGLLIGGFSIIMATTNSDSLYCMILFREGKKKVSLYKLIIIRCIEPLVWFSILLSISFIFKILYLVYPYINLIICNPLIIKVILISLLLFSVVISINSLIVFIINITNIVFTNSRFEILKRYADNTDMSFEELISQHEDSLNN